MRFSEPPAVRRGYLIGLLSLSYAVAFIDRALVAVAAGPIQHDLQINDSQFALLHGTAFVALYCLCGLPMGWLADRMDRRALIAAGMLAWSAMTVVCGLAGSFDTFLLGRIGVGLAEASLMPAAVSLLGGTVSRAGMARAVAIFLMGATAGNATALLGGGLALSWLSSGGNALVASLGLTLAPWRVLFVAAGPLGVVVAALYGLAREPARAVVSDRDRPSVSAAIAHLRAHRRAYVHLTAATACCVLLSQAQAAWMPLLFSRQFDLSSDPGAGAWRAGVSFALAAPAGQWFGGYWIDRLRARGVGAPSHRVLAICALACMPAAAVFCTTHEPLVAQVAYAIFNFVVFAATPAGLTGWQMLTPERHRGLVTALLASIVTLIGVGIGPVLVGLLTDYAFGDPRALGVCLLIVLGFAAAGTVAFAWTGMRCARRESKSEYRDTRGAISRDCSRPSA